MIETPTRQVPGIYRRRIGEIVVTALSDGYLDAPYEFFRVITPAEAETILREARVAAPPRVSINCFVVHSAGRVALIDNGSGTTMGPTLGHLPRLLGEAGIGLGEIDTLIHTHMHPDHSNGLTRDDGTAWFPNAEMVVSEIDVQHWHNDAAMAKASERHRIRFFEAARRQIKPYWNRRRDAKGEVFPGVTAVPLYGHTPGHTGYMIASGKEQLFIWGDTTHFPDVQTRRPEVYVDPDSDPEAAVASRRRVFDMVATDRLLVAGMHTHFPGFLYLEPRSGGGYRAITENWVQVF